MLFIVPESGLVDLTDLVKVFRVHRTDRCHPISCIPLPSAASFFPLQVFDEHYAMLARAAIVLYRLHTAEIDCAILDEPKTHMQVKGYGHLINRQRDGSDPSASMCSDRSKELLV